MNRIQKAICLFTVLVTLCALTACQSPMLTFPGKALQGKPTSTENFEFASKYKLLKLEVRPDEPYSVILRATLINGALLVDAAPARKWGKLLAENPEARVQLGDQLYNVTAVQVDDPAIIRRFFSGRTIYRLEPR